MKNQNKIQRRDLIKTLAVGATTAFIGSGFTKLEAQEVSNQLKGNINHSVCQWCYPDLSLDELCEVAKEFGYKQCYIESASQLKAAIHIYESYGFKHLNGALGNTGHFSCGVWMIKDL